MRLKFLSAAFALALGIGSVAAAQPGTPARSRPALEQQLRERMATITRQRLKLDDAQMTKLEAVNARFAPQMAALVTQERQTRQQLRQLLTSAAPDQTQVGTLLDTVVRLQKQRIALLEAEQKDLSAFLTPVQRAKYMSLQAQIRRRADQLRARGAGKRGRAGKQPPG